MDQTKRTWRIFRIALIPIAIIVLFFSGILPLEEWFADSIPDPISLGAAVLPGEIVALTNQNRIDDGQPALKVNPLLTQAAQMKADDMAQRSYYAHISPDGKTPLYWLDRAGYKYLNAGENLVIDRTSSDEVVSAWMHSPDHRENILRPQFTEIGVGVAYGRYEGQDTIYAVQEFGTPLPSAPAPTLVPVTIPVPEVKYVAQTPKPVVVSVPKTTPKLAVKTPTLGDSVGSLAKPVTEGLRPTTSIPVRFSVASDSPVELTGEGSTTDIHPSEPSSHWYDLLSYYLRTFGASLRAIM